MRLESARELKRELVAELEVPAPEDSLEERAAKVARRLAELGLRAGPTALLSDAPPMMALGVTRRGKRDYRVAVRLQRPALVASPAVERVRTRAKKEVDVRFIGRVFKQAKWYRATCRPLLIG